MNNLAKRKVMKKLYIARETLECYIEAIKAANIHPVLARPIALACASTLGIIIREAPASIFRTDKPEIDKRRARRYRESRTLSKPGVTFTPEQRALISQIPGRNPFIVNRDVGGL